VSNFIFLIVLLLSQVTKFESDTIVPDLGLSSYIFYACIKPDDISKCYLLLDHFSIFKHCLHDLF
jgi:hypothetical protein